MTDVYGAIEAGGTKFICGVGCEFNELETIRIETTTPEQTLAEAAAFFHRHDVKLSALGIGSFGPIDVRLSSDTYGFITTTPKPGWGHQNLVEFFKKIFHVPVGFDTDVNAAVLAEHMYGAGKGIDNLLYLTIGTGIGGGALVNGRLIHGLLHPEMGHIFLPKVEDDAYEGSCPYHGAKCFEGLASGTAIEGRWKTPGANLPRGHRAWELQSEYIARALVNYICTLSPERIILGGGVMSQYGLFEKVRKKTLTLLSGYIDVEALQKNIDQFIVAPGLAGNSGIVGAFELAKRAQKIHCL